VGGEDGKPEAADQYFRSQVGEQGMRLLYKPARPYRFQVLRSHRITVLTEQDQQRTVPWLRLEEEVLKEKGPVTVKDAFFFESL
jgi:hypothetical protein